jgi:DNA-binding beta-propeller fold protein YncE
MKRLVVGIFLVAGLLVTRAFAQESSGFRISTTASLFDQYDLNTKWAQLPPGQSWGEGGTVGVAVDGKGTVIVLVRAAPYFRVFTTDGKFVRSWGEAGQFDHAHSVHFSPDGSVWATDPNIHLLYKFTPKGQLLMTLGKRGVAGDNTSRDLFNRPAGLAIAPNGDIFVADGYGNSRIVHLDKEGKFIKIIGGKKGNGPGELQLPHAVAVDPMGRLIVADSGNKRITIFDRDGNFVKSFPGPSRGGIAVTADGTIYASDIYAGAVTVFKNDRIVDVIRVGDRPHGMAVDPTTGDVYSASTDPDVPNVTKASPKKPATK